MTRTGHSATILTPTGDIVPNAPIEIRLYSTGLLANIYERDGTPITQLGATADENGIFRFWADPDEYFARHGGIDVPVTVPAGNADLDLIRLISGASFLTLEDAINSDAKEFTVINVMERSSGQGGGGTWWRIDSGNAANGFDRVYMNTGNNRDQLLFVPAEHGMVNIAQLGASTSDNTNNGQVINHAIANYNMVKVSAGNYEVLDEIMVPRDGVSMIGSGGANRGLGASVITQAGEHDSVISVTNENFNAEGLSFAFKERNNSGYVIKDLNDSGIADKDYRFINCGFYAAGAAVLIYGRGLHLINCQFGGLADIVHADFPNPFTPGGNPDQTSEAGFRAIFIEGGRAHGCNGYAIRSTGWNASNLNGVAVTGMWSDSNLKMLIGSFANATVTGCNFQYVDGTPFYLEDIDGLVVDGCAFSGTRGETNNSGRTSSQLTSFMEIVGGRTVSDIVVTNNIIRDCYSNVFRLSGASKRTSIDNNKIINCLTQHSHNPGAERYIVRIGDECQEMAVTNNTITTPAVNTSVVGVKTTHSDVTLWSIEGNTYNTALFPDGEINIASDNSARRQKNVQLYTGDGASSMDIILETSASWALVTRRTGEYSGVATSGTSVGDCVLTGRTLTVSGDANINGGFYTIITG